MKKTLLLPIAAFWTILFPHNSHSGEYTVNVPITVTMYNAEKSQTDSTPFLTASNTHVQDGIIALSKDLEDEFELKFGDLVWVSGFPYPFVFADRTHNRMKRRADIFCWSKKEAKAFGKINTNLLIRRRFH